jgi:hypothetical protein
MNKLNQQQKNVLAKIRKSIICNPFTRDRLIADCELTGLPPDDEPAAILKQAIQVAEAAAKALCGDRLSPTLPQTGKSRQLIDGLFLFVIFHRYLNQFDQHIKKQERHEVPVKLACAQDLVRDFANFGYGKQETARYIAVFFQMRRAFYFISTTLPGDCPCMQELRIRLWNNIFTHDTGLYVDLLWNRMEDFSTILTGDTGTGKGVAASAIGRSGYIPFDLKTETFKESFTSAFLAINLSQIPEQLIESELFGHTRGAFTGATRDHAGIFARSSRYGAVFLDEIGELSPHIQVKLLRILQERVFTPVGGSTTEKFSGRVIAATNRNISTLRQQGKFRNDFYYRLCSDTITIPRLCRRIRENRYELNLLINHLLTRITGTTRQELIQNILTSLKKSLPDNYAWPGNVRELEQSIRQILLAGTYIPETRLATAGQNSLTQAFEQGSLTMAELAGNYCKHLYARHGTFQQVARITGLDRRTVKKYLALHQK